jgi:hypothetical protein
MNRSVTRRSQGALGRRAARLLAILLAAVLIWTVAPQAVAKSHLLIHQRGFARVVDGVRTGQLAPDEYGMVIVPRGYGLRLSRADQVLVKGRDADLTVFFLTSRGAVGGWGGFMYTATDSANAAGPDFTAQRLKPNWFRIASD